MRPAALVLFLAILALPTAAAHVTVLPGSGDSSENATILGVPPARVFDALPLSGGYHYYRVALESGQSVQMRLLAAPGAFLPNDPPSLLLVSFLVNDSGLRPAGLPLPEGSHVAGFAGDANPPSFVDWKYPARFVAFVDRPFVAPESGSYDVVVFSRDGGGPYALAIEKPEGSPVLDAYLIVSDRTAVYAWSGEPFWITLLAFAIGAIPVIISAAWRWRKGERFSGFAKGGALVASVLFAASASSLTWEMLRVGFAWQTVGLIAVSVLVGATTLMCATEPGEPGWRRRAVIFGAGLVGLASWNGALIGPVLAILTPLLPDEKASTSSQRP